MDHARSLVCVCVCVCVLGFVFERDVGCERSLLVSLSRNFHCCSRSCVLYHERIVFVRTMETVRTRP
jgi:hypothetical protein